MSYHRIWIYMLRNSPSRDPKLLLDLPFNGAQFWLAVKLIYLEM
jgi:hypothetical protein